jgi:hypothetical protein
MSLERIERAGRVSADVVDPLRNILRYNGLGRKILFNSRCQRGESRFRKSEQGDKWNFCLTAGKIGPRIRRDDEQTSTPKSLTGLQGEGGAGGNPVQPGDIAFWSTRLAKEG